jgi:hypothetical protein
MSAEAKADRITSMMQHPCVAHLEPEERAAAVAAAVSKELTAPNWLDEVETLEPVPFTWVPRGDSKYGVTDPTIRVDAGLMSIVDAVSTVIGGDLSGHLVLDAEGVSGVDLLGAMRIAASAITSSKPGAIALFHAGHGSGLIVEARW